MSGTAAAAKFPCHKVVTTWKYRSWKLELPWRVFGHASTRKQTHH